MSLRTLVNTWGVAGCFQVSHDSKQVLFCSWQFARAYYSAFEERYRELADAYTDRDIMSCLCKVEEKFRTEAIELSRPHLDDALVAAATITIPWGIALLTALRDNHSMWFDALDTLRAYAASHPFQGAGYAPSPRAPRLRGGGAGSGKKRRPGAMPFGAADTQQQNPAQTRSLLNLPPPPPGPGGRESKGGKNGKGSGLKTCSTTRQGSKICKRFNDNRGCSPKCDHGLAHVCDVMLVKSGEACGRQDHGRSQHKEAHHGAAQRV